MTVAVDLTADDMRAFAAAVRGVLKEIRKKAGLSQADVARRTGGLVSKAAYAN